MRDDNFKELVKQGIPDSLPPPAVYDLSVNHAPKRKDLLSQEEKRLALRNALRYFPAKHHEELAAEFLQELNSFGRIYMYRFRPTYAMHARPIDAYPFRCMHAGTIMLMIQNNLDPAVAQHPHELITYGGNGAVFQNWAQYLLTMKYLSVMEEDQTLHMYSGHPLGLFPSSPDAPRVVVTNGMMVPNYSSKDDWERYNALGVTQYGQMTAGSYMYIGPQGIVHGTTITLMNVRRKLNLPVGSLFVSSGLGGMSGAQPKAAKIAGFLSVTAEVNPLAIRKRFEQGWVDEVLDDLTSLVARVQEAQRKTEVVSIGYLGNVVEVWEHLLAHGIKIDVGSDQTSLHNPWAGGYYPADLSFEEAKRMMAEDPFQFQERVRKSLVRQVHAINGHHERGMYFFDYGNAFLLEASRSGADIMHGASFRYPSYVEDLMGPLCFDYGFGPFRWVCASGKSSDLIITDRLAMEVLRELVGTSREEIKPQLLDNISWIEQSQENNLVVGSKARILYADAMGRVRIALAFNEAIRAGKIGPVVLGRDHHDVSGTDSPFRETANIHDGSKFTADMAVHNVIGDAFRGATWISLHNGGGVGWGEVINGGFGIVLDGSTLCDVHIKRMLSFDVHNGMARRAWARNPNALSSMRVAMANDSKLEVTLPQTVDENVLHRLFAS